MLLCFSMGCVNDIKKVESLSRKSIGIEVARDINSYYYGPKGQLKGHLTSPILYHYLVDTPYTIMNQGLRVEFYNDSMQVSSVLTARIGKYYENTSDILVQDSVVLINNKGERLDCQELHWDPRKQQFYTDKPVRITTPSEIIYGQNLTAPEDFSWYKLGSTSGQIQADTSIAP